MNENTTLEQKAPAIPRGIMGLLRRVGRAMIAKSSPRPSDIDPRPFSRAASPHHETTEERMARYRDDAQFRWMLRGHF